MQIPCISCQSRFRLDKNLVKATGSLVRCSKCGCIFMVHPPDFDDEAVVKDTNIDQRILEEIFEIEQIKRYQGILDQIADKIDNQRVDEMASVEDFEEKGDPDSKVNDSEYAELPDLSEYENMIDWDDLLDEGDPTEHEKKFYNSFQDLDINQA